LCAYYHRLKQTKPVGVARVATIRRATGILWATVRDQRADTLVLRGDEVWPVEVNPRYTASIELLERALQIDVIALHVDACRNGQLPQLPQSRIDSRFYGKAINFTTTDMVVSRSATDHARRCNEDSEWPVFADLPFDGSVIKSGQPFATAFAHGVSFSEVESRLQELWQSLFAYVGEP